MKVATIRPSCLAKMEGHARHMMPSTLRARGVATPPTPSPSPPTQLSSPGSEMSTTAPKYRCSRADTPDQHPNCAVTFAFLAEGAANAVFQIRPGSDKAGFNVFFEDQDGTPIPHSRLLNKVLRVSKGIPKTLPYNEIISGYENVIHPLFRTRLPSEDKLDMSSFADYLMDDEGVVLNQEIVRHLHAEMHGEQCASGPCATVPDMELYGILLPDMSSIPDQAFTIEIKPKWLAQSPTAPRDALMCRTCALQRLRIKQGKKPKDPYMCPLQLVAGNTAAIEKYIRHRLRDGIPNATSPVDAEPIIQRLTSYLATGPGHTLLAFLRALQIKHDDVGVTMRPATPPRLTTSVATSSMADYDHRLRLAMTLRDCSFFIRISYADPSDMSIEAKLCDLDFKSADKIEGWWEKEKRLINGGWYTSVEPGSACAVTEAWRDKCPWYV